MLATNFETVNKKLHIRKKMPWKKGKQVMKFEMNNRPGEKASSLNVVGAV